MGFNGELEDISRQQEALHKLEENQYWQQVRFQAAIAAMQGMMANPDPRIYWDDVPKAAVGYADALVEELKKEK